MNNTERVATLQDRLREALEVKGMKAIELSEATDIPKGAISYYLSGKSSPKADRISAMSAALGVSETWLMGYDVSRERTSEQKKNDNLVKITARLRKDAKFFNMVSDLAELNEDAQRSIEQLLLVLKNK